MPGDKTGEVAIDSTPPHDVAFAALGNEIRMEILWTLYDSSAFPPYKLSFSDLQSQITADIAPSQLTYHLQQLIGLFVKKRDGYYQLSPTAEHLCRSLQAGIFHQNEKQMKVDAEFACHYCQAQVKAIFKGKRVYVQCTKCEYIYLGSSHKLQFGTFEDKSKVYAQFKKYKHHEFLGFAHGVCMSCGNAVGAEFCTPNEVPLKIAQSHNKVGIDRSCKRCNTKFFLTVGGALLVDPAIIGFCLEHGVNVLSTPFWELEFAGTDKLVTVRSTDPWKVTLKVTFDNDTLELVVNGDLKVVESNRREKPENVETNVKSELQESGDNLFNSESTDKIKLPDKNACLQLLRQHRWSNGLMCPHCASQNITKKGLTCKDAQRYRCHNCNSIFNDLTGTIFAEHRLTIPEMFFIIHNMDEEKTAPIARQLERSYQSVLEFVHEVKDSRDEDSEFWPLGCV